MLQKSTIIFIDWLKALLRIILSIERLLLAKFYFQNGVVYLNVIG